MSFTGDFFKSTTAVGDNLWLTAFVALLPILYFFWALAIKKMKGHVAGITTLLLTMVLAIIFFKMPVMMTVMTVSQGAIYGLLPIGWIIVTSVFLYKITVKTGQFSVIRSSIISITEDRRLQAILIAFSFGAFLEGAAGFGAPVAITASLLVGLGFKPLHAAGLCLIANTAPVAFGAIGIPITSFGNLGPEYDVEAISAMVGRQLPFISVFIPIYITFVMVGFKKTKEVMPALLVAGVSFAFTQFFVSNYMGPELPDILSSLVSIVSLTVFLKFWKPKTIYRFKDEANSDASTEHYSGRRVLKAWSPFLVLTGLVTLWGIPSIKAALNGAMEAGGNAILTAINSLGQSLEIIADVPFVSGHLFDAAGNPVVFEYKIQLLGAAGTAILIAAVISKFIVKISWRDFAKTFGETAKEIAWPLVTIMSVVAFSAVANNAGMMAALGAALATTGMLFTFLAPVLGWLGVFVTGSDTSANLLFGPLQYETAKQIGMDPILALAANSSGGVTGKMISPQSIAIACAAVGISGKEAELLRFTLKHSLILLLMICVITFLQTNVLSFMVP